MTARPADLSQPPPVRLWLLGPPRWASAHGAGPVAPVDALLLYLLVAAGAWDRGALAARLWPDSEARLAQANLRQRVFRLRRLLGAPAVVGSSTLALSATVAVDLHGAEAALADDPSAAQGALLEGIAWPDEALEAWLEAERRAWRHRLSQRLAGLASQARDGGDWRAALPYAQRLVEHWPEDDAAYHRLMQLHVMGGDLAAAHEVYRRCEATLLREDGRRPGPQTRALAARIATALVAAPPGALAPGPQPPARLAGRRAEWQRLQRAWQVRRPLLVSGEPGIGKSRLIGEFGALQGALGVGARPGDAERPYALLQRLLESVHGRCGAPEADWVRRESARLLPWLGVAPQGPTYALRLQAAVAEWWRHAHRAGLPGLAVDDLQYADTASLELLLDAGAEPELGWLFAVRAAEWPALLQRRLADARSDAVEHLHLEPLDAAGVAELLCGAGFAPPRAEALSAGLWRHTGGNPYFVLQTVFESARAPATEAPPAWAAAPHLQAVLQRRLDRLTPPARQLAQAAALAGADFSAELAARLLDCPLLDLAPAWLELERAQILRGDGFAHDLAREAVLSQLPAAVARAAHRRLGELGPALGMAAAQQAVHWLAAGDDRRAAVALSSAAEDAGRLSRRVEEARLLDQALDCLARLGEPLFAVLERRVRAGRYMDSHDRQLEAARRLLAAAGDAGQRGRALVALAAVLRDGFQVEAARAAAEEAAALAADTGDAGLRLAAARELARALEALGQHAEALQALAPHRDAALAVGDADAARLLIDLGMVLCRASLRQREAWAVLQRARRIAEAAGDWGLLAEAQLDLGYVLQMRAQVGRSAVFYRQARETHLRTGTAHSVRLMHFVGLPRLYRELGRYGPALALLEGICAEQGRGADYALATVADADLSYLWLQLGEPARATAALEGPEQLAQGRYLPSWLLAQARLALWSGRPATDLLQQAFDLVSAENRVLRWFVGRALAMSLAPAAGLELARTLLAECEPVECETALWPLRVALADRLLAAGDSEAAADAAAAVLRAFGRRVLPSMHEPQAWLVVERALAAAGRSAGAQAARERGRRWIAGALPQVPPAWRDGFLLRNPHVAALWAPAGAAASQPASLAG